MINLGSGDIRLEGGATELFGVAVGRRTPGMTATGFLNEEIHKPVTIDP